MAAIFNPIWRTTDHKPAKGSNFFMTHIPCIYQIRSQILYSLKDMVNLTQLLEYVEKLGRSLKRKKIVPKNIFLIDSRG